MMLSGTTARGLTMWATCQSSEYLPPTRARSGPVRLLPHWNGMIVLALGRQAVVAVALDLVTERPDHLAVAGVAALADVDVAPGELER